LATDGLDFSALTGYFTFVKMPLSRSLLALDAKALLRGTILNAKPFKLKYVFLGAGSDGCKGRSRIRRKRLRRELRRRQIRGGGRQRWRRRWCDRGGRRGVVLLRATGFTRGGGSDWGSIIFGFGFSSEAPSKVFEDGRRFGAFRRGRFSSIGRLSNSGRFAASRAALAGGRRVVRSCRRSLVYQRTATMAVDADLAAGSGRLVYSAHAVATRVQTKFALFNEKDS